MKDCKKHYSEMYETRLGESPCPWCELDVLRESLRKVQAIAKSALDKLPERWNMGFQAGLKQAIPYEKELQDALKVEKKARQDDNAQFTAGIMRVEAALESLLNVDRYEDRKRIIYEAISKSV